MLWHFYLDFVKFIFWRGFHMTTAKCFSNTGKWKSGYTWQHPGLTSSKCVNVKCWNEGVSVFPYTADKTHKYPHAQILNWGLSLTVLLCLGQLHELLLFQCVHHVRKASFAALRRAECEADHGLPAIPGTLLWLVWRGRVSPVGVDWAAFTAFIVLGNKSAHESWKLEAVQGILQLIYLFTVHPHSIILGLADACLAVL